MELTIYCGTVFSGQDTRKAPTSRDPSTYKNRLVVVINILFVANKKPAGSDGNGQVGKDREDERIILLSK